MANVLQPHDRPLTECPVVGGGCNNCNTGEGGTLHLRPTCTKNLLNYTWNETY